MTKAELERKKNLARTLYMGQPGRMEGAAGCHKRDPPGAGKQAAP